MMNIKPITFFPVIILVLVALQASGCRDHFQPLTKNNQYALSIGGYLALHVDTQWVRVMPIGKTLIPRTGEPNNLTVTVTRQKTGTTSTLRDSLFMFGNNALVWNYWAKLSLHPNEEYIFLAKGPEGEGRTKVMMPSRLPLPVVHNFDSTRGIVRGVNPDTLVMADIKYYVREILRGGRLSVLLEARISHLDHVYHAPNGEYQFKFDDNDAIEREIGYTRFGFVVERAELIVATASETWPEYANLTEREIELPGLVSNIENGTGFVAGIAKRIVPLKNCFDDEGNRIGCEEIY